MEPALAPNKKTITAKEILVDFRPPAISIGTLAHHAKRRRECRLPETGCDACFRSSFLVSRPNTTRQFTWSPNCACGIVNGSLFPSTPSPGLEFPFGRVLPACEVSCEVSSEECFGFCFAAEFENIGKQNIHNEKQMGNPLKNLQKIAKYAEVPNG